MQDILFEIEVYLVMVNVIILFIFAGIFWYKMYKESEIASQKWYQFGIGLFLLCFGFTRIFFTLSDLVFKGYWIGFGLGWEIYWKFAAISGIGSLLFVLIVLEKYMVKTKFVLSAIVLAGLIAAIILPLEEGLAFDARFATYITSPIAALGILGIYLYLTIKATGSVRKKSALAFIGILIALLGFTINTVLGKELIGVDLGILATILMIIGIVVFSFSNF
jgi:hypothetical protein